MNARSASSTGSKRRLIARLWHGAVPAAKGDDYAVYLGRTGVTECRATPGNRGVEVLRRWLDGFWDETLGAFKEAAEQAATKARRSQ